MQRSGQAVEAAIGYAVGSQGRGVAYARLEGSPARQVLRLPFRIAEAAAPTDSASGYAAVTAVAQALRERGFGKVRFLVSDAKLVEEITTRQPLSERLFLSYVQLRCVLNALSAASFGVGSTSDLTQRARAEVTLN